MTTENSVVCTPPIFRYKEPSAVELSVFLAGTIEMGASVDWQSQVINMIQKSCSIIYNPRRADFDPAWKQELEDPNFNVQVSWELEMIEKCDFVFMYLDPTSKSPISLLELGIIAQIKPKQTFVVCPEGFWRKGNVDIVCNKYGIKQYTSLDVATLALRQHCERVYDKYKIERK